MMWEIARDKITAMGSDIVMDRDLASLRWDGAAWSVEVKTGAGASETYTAANVISSAPITELVRRPPAASGQLRRTRWT